MANEELPSAQKTPSEAELVQHAAEKLSSETKVFEQMTTFGMGIMGSGSPIQNKMTAEHISTVLEIAGKHDERQFEITKAGQEQEHQNNTEVRRLSFAVLVIVLFFIGIILFTFKEKPEILVPVIGTVVGFAGGFGVGRSSKTE